MSAHFTASPPPRCCRNRCKGEKKNQHQTGGMKEGKTCPPHLNRNETTATKKKKPMTAFVLCRHHCSLVGIHLCSNPQEPRPSELIRPATCFVTFVEKAHGERKREKNLQCMVSKCLTRGGPPSCVPQCST